jgi:hypothetical protein
VQVVSQAQLVLEATELVWTGFAAGVLVVPLAVNPAVIESQTRMLGRRRATPDRATAGDVVLIRAAREAFADAESPWES